MAKRNEMRIVDVQQMLNTMISVMGESFQEGDSVQLVNFGTFDVKKKLERVIVSLSTGQRMLVPPKLTLAFRPIATVKDKIRKGGEDNG